MWRHISQKLSTMEEGLGWFRLARIFKRAFGPIAISCQICQVAMSCVVAFRPRCRMSYKHRSQSDPAAMARWCAMLCCDYLSWKVWSRIEVSFQWLVFSSSQVSYVKDLVYLWLSLEPQTLKREIPNNPGLAISLFPADRNHSWRHHLRLSVAEGETVSSTQKTRTGLVTWFDPLSPFTRNFR